MTNLLLNRLPGGQWLTPMQKWQTRRLLLKLLQTGFIVMLLALLLLATGCATHSPLPCEPLPPISKPVPDKSPPSENFLIQVQNFLDESQKKLTSGLPRQ